MCAVAAVGVVCVALSRAVAEVVCIAIGGGGVVVVWCLGALSLVVVALGVVAGCWCPVLGNAGAALAIVAGLLFFVVAALWW